MNKNSQKNLVALLLAVLMVWPMVHIGLVKVFDLNPWKLFGYGMYSRTPVILDNIDIGAMSEPGGAPIAPPAWSPAMEEAARAYLSQRKWLGNLVTPRAVAEATLRAHPELDGVVMRVTRLEVNPKTSRVEAKQTYYRYPRE